MAKVKMPKPPRKPKVSASLTTWQRYEERTKEWEKQKREKEADEKKRQAIIKKHRK